MAVINGKTQLFGLLGFPVEHTASPIMHNAAFMFLNINAVYLPFPVEPDNLKKAVSGLRALGILGVNVTIPHKQKIIPYLDSLAKEAKIIQAVNTIEIIDGKLIGHNTDGIGFIRALKKEANFYFKDKTVFLAGAGGAGYAIATQCVLEGASQIGIYEKNIKRANNLVELLSHINGECELHVLRNEDVGEYLGYSDIAINATPLGMKPNDPSTFDVRLLNKNAIVYDVVYNVPQTTLIKNALQLGIKAYGGLSMLLYQGVEAFEIWTKQPAPIDVMADALRKIVYGDTA